MPQSYQTGYKRYSGLFQPRTPVRSTRLRVEDPRLASLLIENTTEARVELPVQTQNVTVPEPLQHQDLVNLGVWLASLESFFASGASLTQVGEPATGDTSKEFQLAQAAFIRTAGLTSSLLLESDPGAGLSIHELAALASVLRDSIVIGGCMVNSADLGPAEWKAWTSTVSERLSNCTAFNKIVDAALAAGRDNLPPALRALVAHPHGEEQAELALILPRFGKVLLWLEVVGKMLKADEPLKPAIIILSCVSEEVSSLIDLINLRLKRFADEDSAVFGTLDAAAYTASIEAKKVYTQELNGVAQMRPSPTIYARMETAHSLLSEGFQQILASIAKTIDPHADPLTLFPNFRVKLEQSLALRRDLNQLASIVQTAEKDPEKKNIDVMRSATLEFMERSVPFLFYKDSETLERFVEEVMVAKQNKDLVPILHRFGAYLDTLFGQVSLRTVLANHPFES